jgi:hypothetical protein
LILRGSRVSKPRYQRFVACGDSHGDKADPSAVAAFHELCDWFKPTIRIAAGDHFDLRCLRRNASEGEKRERVQADIDAGLEFLKRFKPTHFLRGNHDERLWDAAISDDGKLADFASYLILDIKDVLGPNCVMYPYHKRQGVLTLGQTKVIHGYGTGVNAARRAGMVYGSCLMFHVHAIDLQPVPGLERRVARACGCLCELDQDYNRAHLQTLAQAHGFVYGLLLPTGETVVWQAEKIAGRWFFPSEFREVKGDRKR